MYYIIKKCDQKNGNNNKVQQKTGNLAMGKLYCTKINYFNKFSE